jgi:hypothetical protein
LIKQTKIKEKLTWKILLFFSEKVFDMGFWQKHFGGVFEM